MKQSIVLAVMIVSVWSFQAHAQFDSVGSIEFATSGSAEAQQHFLRGAAILHSFGWKQAREQFQAAQRIEPDFAMAYWGESLAYNHPLVSQMDATEPRQALERLAPTREERLAKAPTAREKGLLGAVEVLWGDGDHVARRVGYMEAMRALHEQYPDDREIALFYALSMMSATRATGDQSLRLEMRAGAIALPIFSRDPDHPGAAHYTIHAFDDPLHAPLALPAARRYAEIAPAVSHARHMPTHIFIQHGMWDMVSGHNQSAHDAAMDLWEPGDSIGDAVHSLDWGHYGDLQRGDYARARRWTTTLDEIAERTGQGRARGSLPGLKARYVVETEEWEVRPVSADLSATELLAVGLSAVRTGDLETAAEVEAALRSRASAEEDGSGVTTKIMHREVAALLHAARGDADAAIAAMDEALDLVNTLRPPNGPATPIKPAYELYGEILLELDRPEAAVEMFETSLLRLPNRPRSLLGLARAHAQLGETTEAAEQYAALARVWAGRDALPGLQEAKRFLQETEEP